MLEPSKEESKLVFLSLEETIPESILTSENLEILYKFSDLENIKLCVISSLSKEEMDKLFKGNADINLFAENGYYYKFAGEDQWIKITEACSDSWVEQAEKIMRNYSL
mmetsp:Transcript_5719/g.4886  ORF Transcript_5719/g.4886 Transcript_5719/m.4886 type:complete len:108 (+) Transcript_5719:2211-2534(+)